jgi:hypothetical protein
VTYDSTQDTEKHIETVRGFLSDVIGNLAARSLLHDGSKLVEPEKSMYDEFTPKLKGSTYGSDEYKGFLKDMGVALKHHYENNSHHPEHYENGINGMTLMDLVEMLADWKAAGMRHANGNIEQSLEINRKRFGMSDQLFEIFKNTVKNLGW